MTSTTPAKAPTRLPLNRVVLIINVLAVGPLMGWLVLLIVDKVSTTPVGSPGLIAGATNAGVALATAGWLLVWQQLEEEPGADERAGAVRVASLVAAASVLIVGPAAAILAYGAVKVLPGVPTILGPGRVAGYTYASAQIVCLVWLLGWRAYIGREPRTIRDPGTPRSSWELVPISGWEGGAFPIDDDIEIGRSGSDWDLALRHDDGISNPHARIELSGGKVFIVPNHNANGTYVDERRITSRKELWDGARVRMSQTIFEVRGR
jgi:hypothetical protein